MICGLRHIALSLSVLFIIACAPERPKPEVIDFTDLCQVGETPPQKQSIFKDSIESTVRIYVIRRDKAFYNELNEAYGTGVIIDSQAGLILTAAHVVKDAAVIEATTRKVNDQGGIEDSDSMYLTVLSADHDYDTAVLMVKKQRSLPPAMPLSCSWLPLPGRRVAQFGHRTRVSHGQITGYFIRIIPKKKPAIEIRTNANGQPGDSGGPFTEAETGKLVGILIAGIGSDAVFVSLDDLIKQHQGKTPE